MKRMIYFLCYLLALCVGIVLLIFNHEAINTENTTLHNIFIGVGVVFILPGISILIANLRTKRDENGNIIKTSWPSNLTGLIALIWGILTLIMPNGIFGNLNITLGISLVIISIAQIVWIIRERKTNDTPFWIYIIPLIVIGVGGWIIFMKKDFQSPGKEIQLGCVITGILLLFWGINGFLSLSRRIKTKIGATNKANENELGNGEDGETTLQIEETQQKAKSEGRTDTSYDALSNKD